MLRTCNGHAPPHPPPHHPTATTSCHYHHHHHHPCCLQQPPPHCRLATHTITPTASTSVPQPQPPTHHPGPPTCAVCCRLRAPRRRGACLRGGPSQQPIRAAGGACRGARSVARECVGVSRLGGGSHLHVAAAPQSPKESIGGVGGRSPSVSAEESFGNRKHTQTNGEWAGGWGGALTCALQLSFAAEGSAAESGGVLRRSCCAGGPEEEFF